jgi:hypothetical protein
MLRRASDATTHSGALQAVVFMRIGYATAGPSDRASWQPIPGSEPLMLPLTLVCTRQHQVRRWRATLHP